ncbi:hypothetical protein [Streptomyces sp. NPDC099088]|uniref:hypothetical protein n=1 Tax=Streptomyces sp. NPDC099088 TaxID=3366101 RepID=UPI003802524F
MDSGVNLTFKDLALISRTELSTLNSMERRQLIIHCRNYTGEDARDAIEAFDAIAEFGGEAPATYCSLRKFRITDDLESLVLDAWIDEDFGTFFKAGSAIESPIRMADYRFRGEEGDSLAEEMAVSLERSYAMVPHQAISPRREHPDDYDPGPIHHQRG